MDMKYLNYQNTNMTGASGSALFNTRQMVQNLENINFITFVNMTANVVTLVDPQTQNVLITVGTYSSLTIPFDNRYTNGFNISWINTLATTYTLNQNFQIIFSQANLGINVSMSQGFVYNVGGQVVSTLQLPAALSTLGNLKVAIVENIPSGTTAKAGKITVATAGTPVAPASTTFIGGVTFIADATNTGTVSVYPSAGVIGDVYPLSAGDSIFWPVADLNELKVDASANGQKVYWMGAA